MSSTPNSPDLADRDQRTAVLIVAGEDSAPERAFESLRRHFGEFYDQIIFISIGLVDYQVIDAPDFKGSEVGPCMSHAARGAVTNCVEQARQAGMSAITCVAVGTDPVDEVEKLAVNFAKQCPRAMFFLGKLVFRRRKWYHALLHARTGEAIQKRLERCGLPIAILPFVLPA
ncbi:MAG: hypothetical protein JO332_03020 [Planctomycetaceae bacterium]|nr:hypothetical protein [Planctomycetaceae bacterium]